jgi:hypothetical protein
MAAKKDAGHDCELAIGRLLCDRDFAVRRQTPERGSSALWLAFAVQVIREAGETRPLAVSGPASAAVGDGQLRRA